MLDADLSWLLPLSITLVLSGCIAEELLGGDVLSSGGGLGCSHLLTV